MKTILIFFFTIYTWIVTVLAFVIHFPIAFALMFLFKDKQFAHMRITSFFIKISFFITGIKVKVKGLENIPKDRNFIIMSNHQSLLEVIVYLAYVPYKFSFIAKKELKKVPLLGQNILIQGHELIDRGNPREAIKLMQGVKETVKNGRSLLIFAEGTRSRDGSILPFKKGGFVLAIETNTAIVPAYVHGAASVIKKKSLLISPGNVTITFSKPIVPKQIKLNSPEGKKYLEQLIKLTRQEVLKLQEENASKNK